MKKNYFLFFILSTVCIAVFGIGLNMQNSNKGALSLLSLGQIEALATNEPPKGTYDMESKDCAMIFTVDADGYIVVFKKKIFVGLDTNGTFEQVWSDASTSCPVGTKFASCTPMTCGDFYIKMGGL